MPGHRGKTQAPPAVAVSEIVIRELIKIDTWLDPCFLEEIDTYSQDQSQDDWPVMHAARVQPVVLAVWLVVRCMRGLAFLVLLLRLAHIVS